MATLQSMLDAARTRSELASSLPWKPSAAGSRLVGTLRDRREMTGSDGRTYTLFIIHGFGIDADGAISAKKNYYSVSNPKLDDVLSRLMAGHQEARRVAITYVGTVPVSKGNSRLFSVDVLEDADFQEIMSAYDTI